MKKSAQKRSRAGRWAGLSRRSQPRRDQEQGGELDSHEEVSPEEIESREVSWTLMKKLAQKRSRAGRWAGLSWRSQPRRDREQGGELDSHEEVSLEEIKSTPCWAWELVELGLRVGLLLLQLFPNGGATDIVFVTLFCIAAGTAIAWCGGRCAMPDGHCLNILLFWMRSTAASVFRVGACFEVSLFCHRFPTRPRP